MDPNNPIPGSTAKPDPDASGGADLAANVIRSKISALYQDEPNAAEESKEVQQLSHRSKHQQYMYELTNSGKSLAEIQTTWHEYYRSLPDHEKHQVWQEFYSAHAQARQAGPEKAKSSSDVPAEVAQPAKPAPKPIHQKSHNTRTQSRKLKSDSRTVGAIKQQIVGKVNAGGKLKTKHHFQSLAFGLGFGSLVILIMMFGFFNERIIAPFITPSKTVTNTPIIADASAGNGSDPSFYVPKIIVPKINLEVPVVYDQPSIEEAAIQSSLEDGAVHYATTPSPGEKGNTVILGHSSSNILNNGKYKFAFVLLNRLEAGDTFMLTKGGKRYTYKVYERKIVKPTDISVLGANDKAATVTLITCDPPGTSVNRLIIVAEQISPDPSQNGTSTAVKTDKAPTVVPSNSVSLWQKIRNWITS